MSIFSHNLYENVRTRVIVTYENKLLLLSPHEPGDGWRPPGGGLEFNESLAECAEREVLEETGIVVKVTNVAFLREWVVPKYCTVPEGDGIGFGLEVYLYATPITDQVQPHPEPGMTEMPHWIALDQVAALPLWPKELKTLATLMSSGYIPHGVPSFVSQLESPNAPAPAVNFT